MPRRAMSNATTATAASIWRANRKAFGKCLPRQTCLAQATITDRLSRDGEQKRAVHPTRVGDHQRRPFTDEIAKRLSLRLGGRYFAHLRRLAPPFEANKLALSL